MTVTHLDTVHAPKTDQEPAADHSAKVRRLSANETTAVAVVVALVVVLGLLGFVNSFAAVMHAAEPSFGPLAWSVPLGIDLGIAIFAALDIVLARLDMRVKWLRLIPWALTAATVYLNVATEDTVFGAIAHATLPALWVIAVEIGAHVVKVRAGIEAGTRMDSIRASRWVLAPWPTAKLWRRMVLWETRSYTTALGRERDRLLARTDLQDTYGKLAWRWKAPRRTRALYRLGELAPASDRPALDPPAHLLALPVADTRPALKGGSAATVADTDSRQVADTVPTPARRNGARKAGTRPATKTATSRGRVADRQADKARALLSADPEMTGAELGRRLKVSERTGLRLRQRILGALADLDHTPTDQTSTARTDAATVEGTDAR
jgi:hypothetical protein